MNAKKFFWILEKIGITRTQFAKSIHLTKQTVFNWKYDNKDVREIYVKHLRDRIGKEIFDKLSQQYDTVCTPSGHTHTHTLLKSFVEFYNLHLTDTHIEHFIQARAAQVHEAEQELQEEHDEEEN